MIILRGAKRSQSEHLTDTAILPPSVATFSKVENIGVLTLKPVTNGQDANGLEITSDITDFTPYSQTPAELSTANKVYYLYNVPADIDTESLEFVAKLEEIFLNITTLIITSDISSTLLDDLGWMSGINGDDNLAMLTMKSEDTATWEHLPSKSGIGVFYDPEGEGQPIDVITAMTAISKTIISPMSAKGGYVGVTDPDQTKILKDAGFSFFVDAKEDNFGYSVFFGKLQYFTLLIYLHVEQAVREAAVNYLKDGQGRTFSDLAQFQGIALNAATQALSRQGLTKNMEMFLPDITQTSLADLNAGNVNGILFAYEAERQQLHQSIVFQRG